MAEKKKTEKITVEEAMERLDEIREIIQKGEISLNESVSLFEEAAKLYSFCNEKLTELEDRVKILAKNAEGKLDIVPFDTDEE